MGRIETIKIPSELHPSGERILKIMYGKEEPPKSYVWGKGEDEFYIWNGRKWVPYEFELIKDNGCTPKNGQSITEEEIAVVFDKYKKDLLASILRMNRSQDSINIENLRNDIEALKYYVHNLEELEHFYTKDQVDAKILEINEAAQSLSTILNNSISAVSRRVTGTESSISDIYPILNRLNNINHSEFIKSGEVIEEI